MKTIPTLLKDHLLDLVFPRTCPICGKIVLYLSSLACPTCYHKVQFVQKPTCVQCGKAIAFERQALCFSCQKQQHYYEKGISLLIYTEMMKNSIARFKYQGKQEYARWYAEEWIKHYFHLLLQYGIQAFLPVPLHPHKYKIRGFNQSESISHELSMLSKIPTYSQFLFRKQNTTPQKNLNPSQRKENLAEAFSVAKLPSSLHTIALVDDIYTTGSTVNACSLVLKKAGIQNIYVISICIGQDY
ncbi:hypothetical protein FACS189418_4650 [Clostridia bacterium]|nr:hypothetical protein FACS189418_4650 [Clostridia bacterium]